MAVSWVFIALGLLALACGQQPPNNDVIISSTNENNHDGSYKYSDLMDVTRSMSWRVAWYSAKPNGRDHSTNLSAWYNSCGQFVITEKLNIGKRYQTSNGISVEEEGFLKNPGIEGQEAQTARGSYSYTAPDGQVITVHWYADETGFHAEGSHIPGATPPAPPSTISPVPPSPNDISRPPAIYFESLPEFYRG